MTEAQAWRAVLAEHYLMSVECDPVTHRDNPICGCSRVHLGWHPSAGAARSAWIEHVADQVTLLLKRGETGRGSLVDGRRCAAADRCVFDVACEFYRRCRIAEASG